MLASNGDDLYIFYTDFGSSNPNDLSRELYGVRYERDMDARDGVNEDWGFGKAVKITDYGKVIDEFDLYMTADNHVSLVSNHYNQWIGSDGTTQQGTNQLVEIEFVPKGSVSVVDERVYLPDQLTAGDIEFITFDVINDGLLGTSGFDVTVYEVQNGTEREIFNQHYETELESDDTCEITELKSGDTCEIQVPWTIPSDVSNTKIKVVVNETGVSVSNPSTAYAEVPYRSSLRFSDPSVKWDGEQAWVTATVTNTGNKDAQACTAQVAVDDEDGKVFASAAIPALASGASAELSIPFTPAAEDFSSFGFIELVVRAVDGDTSLSSTYVRFISTKPILASINEGAASLSLNSGASTALTTLTAPWNELAGTVRYSTSDSSVAAVSQDGTVTAAGSGTATITAYYPDTGLSDTIDVTVTGPASSGGSSSASYASSVADTENGTVAVSPKTAEAGGKVTITPTPDAGYKVGEVTVTDRSGKEIKVTDNGNGTYSFTQPSGKVTIAVSFVPASAETAAFTDVPKNAYYADAVQWAMEQGVTAGTTATTFSPNATCTRAQAVTFLWRNAGSPQPENDVMPFTDVAPGAYYYDAVLWAVEQGITTGTTATTFSPNATCTRAQIVTFLWRSEASPAASAVNPFTDVLADAYYTKAILWAVENGITTGTTVTTFSPSNNCTRAQIVTFLYRCFQ